MIRQQVDYVKYVYKYLFLLVPGIFCYRQGHKQPLKNSPKSLGTNWRWGRDVGSLNTANFLPLLTI